MSEAEQKAMTAHAQVAVLRQCRYGVRPTYDFSDHFYRQSNRYDDKGED